MVAIFVVALPLVILMAIVGLVVTYYTQKDKKEFTFATVFLAYFYTIAVISLMAVTVGFATAGNALLSDVFGRDFSYESHTTYYEAAPSMSHDQATEEADLAAQNILEITQQEKDRIEEQYRQDMFTGVSLLVVGLVFLITHIIGWRTLDKQHGRQPLLFKGYIFTQLAIYSLATLVALPLAISQLLRFWLQPASTSLYPTVAAPGQALSIAIIALPLWLFFIWTAIKLAKPAR